MGPRVVELTRVEVRKYLPDERAPIATKFLYDQDVILGFIELWEETTETAIPLDLPEGPHFFVVFYTKRGVWARGSIYRYACCIEDEWYDDPGGQLWSFLERQPAIR